MADKKDKRSPDLLSKVDMHYIDTHEELSLNALAQDLGKPIEIIKAYCEESIKKSKQKRVLDAANSYKGSVSMTEALSSIGDDARDNYVSLESISRAAAAGDFVLLEELKQKYIKQNEKVIEDAKQRFSDHVHFIRPIE